MTADNVPTDYKDIVNRLGDMLEKMDDITDIDTSDMKPLPDNRLSWDAYFMGMTYLAAQRSSCIRRKVGAIAVKDRRILATGYNGVPSGFNHCTPNTCIRSKLEIPSGQLGELCFAIHAEQNLLVQAAAVSGSALVDSTVYCTTFPCTTCAKLLIGCKVSRIVYAEGYPDTLSLHMLRCYAKLRAENNLTPFDLVQQTKPEFCI